jgi:hypothetical protein
MDWKSCILLFTFLSPIASATEFQQQQQQSSKILLNTLNGPAEITSSTKARMPGQSEMLQWTSTVLTTLFNIDHKRYAQQYASCCKHFYGPTWRKLMHKIRQSGELTSLIERKLNKTTNVGPPQVLQSLQLPGLQGWRVQVPLTIQYHSAEDTQKDTQYKTATLDIVPNPNTGAMKIINFDLQKRERP